MKDFYDSMSDIFQDLLDEGYIYDEDENGRNMSYGEYIAIADYFHECLNEYLEQYAGCEFGEILDAYERFMDGGDDERMFAGMEENTDFIFGCDWDEDGNTLWECYDEDEIPDALKGYWEKYKEEHEYAREYA
jgi:hypothetical protein